MRKAFRAELEVIFQTIVVSYFSYSRGVGRGITIQPFEPPGVGYAIRDLTRCGFNSSVRYLSREIHKRGIKFREGSGLIYTEILSLRNRMHNA